MGPDLWPDLVRRDAAAMTGQTCPRAGKLFGGCKFEARYDEPEPSTDVFARCFGTVFIETMDADQIKAMRSSMRRYVRDICVRCGRTIERDSEKLQ
jgi:hypothetical protein